MKADKLRDDAKKLFRNLIPGQGIDTDVLVDLLIEAATAEIREKHRVDIPNTGYYGIVERKTP